MDVLSQPGSWPGLVLVLLGVALAMTEIGQQFTTIMIGLNWFFLSLGDICVAMGLVWGFAFIFFQGGKQWLSSRKSALR